MNPDTNRFEPLHEERWTPEQKDKVEAEAPHGHCACGRPRARGHHLCTTCAKRERRSRR